MEWVGYLTYSMDFSAPSVATLLPIARSTTTGRRSHLGESQGRVGLSLGSLNAGRWQLTARTPAISWQRAGSGHIFDKEGSSPALIGRRQGASMAISSDIFYIFAAYSNRLLRLGRVPGPEPAADKITNLRNRGDRQLRHLLTSS